jgi:hypothetical protein
MAVRRHAPQPRRATRRTAGFRLTAADSEALVRALEALARARPSQGRLLLDLDLDG